MIGRDHDESTLGSSTVAAASRRLRRLRRVLEGSSRTVANAERALVNARGSRDEPVALRALQHAQAEHSRAESKLLEGYLAAQPALAPRPLRGS